MQEVKISQETINAEIIVYKEFIDEWEQELVHVQADLEKCKERVSLLNELQKHVTPGSSTETVKASINMVVDEVVELTKKESHLSGNIKTYQEFVIELNKML
ncbi:hypothetical protein [Lysinibacillus sp. JNUCC 51]|uniref:hypothetical protein n=1 Tax=Lysinibacillus sp. JNUCC-51 TaxID=2792479 RepID=UPI00193529F6|nr:hypothetical protein JNUCC51_00300 [Lysinibacillus sp. JNUCC-51]